MTGLTVNEMTQREIDTARAVFASAHPMFCELARTVSAKTGMHPHAVSKSDGFKKLALSSIDDVLQDVSERLGLDRGRLNAAFGAAVAGVV